MRKISLFIVAVLLTVSFMGCGDEAPNNTTTQPTTAPVSQLETVPNATVPTTLPETEPATTVPTTPPETEPTTTTPPETEPPVDPAPSKAMVEQDLKAALAEHNEGAKIKKQEIVKSLTEDNSYFVTLSVDAGTQYTDWQYEVDMSYTKYDQGWMLDDVRWTTKSSVLARTPNESQMAALADDIFSTHKSEKLNKLVGIKGGKVSGENPLENGALSFSWSNEVVYKHGVANAKYTSEWCYDSKTDSWSIVKAKKYADTYVEGLQIVETLEKVKVTKDFTGTWSLLNGNPITISNFSANGFDAQWEGNTGKFQRMLSVPGYYLNDAPNTLWYTDGTNYLGLQFYGDKTNLVICEIGVTVNFTAFAEIKAELPKLK